MNQSTKELLYQTLLDLLRNRESPHRIKIRHDRKGQIPRDIEHLDTALSEALPTKLSSV